MVGAALDQVSNTAQLLWALQVMVGENGQLSTIFDTFAELGGAPVHTNRANQLNSCGRLKLGLIISRTCSDWSILQYRLGNAEALVICLNFMLEKNAIF